MKGFLVYLGAGFVCALLQSSLFPLLLPAGLRPNLLLILVLLLGLSEHKGRAIFLALLLGGLQDSFSGTSFGLYASVNLAMLLLMNLASAYLNTESPALLLLVIATGTVVQQLLVGFFLTTFAEAGAVLHLLLAVLPYQLLANLLATVAICAFLVRFRSLLGTRSGLAGLLCQGKRYGA